MSNDMEETATWNRNAILIFFALTIVLHSGAALAYSTLPILPLMLLVPWTPNISAIIVLVLVLRKESGVRNLVRGWTKWRVGLRWYLAALSPALVVTVAVVVYHLLGGVSPGSEIPFELMTLIGYAILVVFTGATGEELGWRGFALPRLQSRFGALTASIMIGLWWGIWHAPGWVLMDTTITTAYVSTFILGTVTGSVFMTWLYNNTDGSLVMASLYHYSVNIFEALAVAVLGLITWEALSLINGIIYLAISAALVIRYGADSLSRKPPQAAS